MFRKLFKKFFWFTLFFFMLLSCANQIYSQEEREQTGVEKSGQDSEQQISDFSLSGFNDQGKKSWDLAGKTADIFENVVKLQDVKGNLYGASENVKLSAEKGDFDKKEGKVHLEKDVIITTSSGAKLTTDSLDWDRKNQIVNTKDAVNIEKENLVATALGATGQPSLNKVKLEKDVQVEIKPVKSGEQKENTVKTKTIITCDGPLEIDYEKNIAIFKNNVKVDNQDALIYSDIMEVFFAKAAKGADEPTQEANKVSPIMNSRIEKLIARGNVKIVKGENISYSEEATYVAANKMIILTGRPKLIISSTDDLKGAFSGN